MAMTEITAKEQNEIRLDQLTREINELHVLNRKQIEAQGDPKYLQKLEDTIKNDIKRKEDLLKREELMDQINMNDKEIEGIKYRTLMKNGDPLKNPSALKKLEEYKAKSKLKNN